MYNIKSWKKLKQFFTANYSNTAALKEGVYVSEKVRREALLGVDQGKIGYKVPVTFKDIGGGIYKAYITITDSEEDKDVKNS